MTYYHWLGREAEPHHSLRNYTEYLLAQVLSELPKPIIKWVGRNV